VGYDEGGQLTEAVRRKPYSVILLDEIEKAHPDVFNILLQVLDEGRLTDNKGRHADFKNTIIIMTSNVGSPLIQKNYEEAGSSGFSDSVADKTRDEVMGLLKQTIRPEFLNRIDDIIMFTPLSHAEIREIVKLQFSRVSKLLKAQDVEISISEKAVDHLADLGFDPLFGARPVRRALQRYVLNDLSKKLLADEVDKEKPVLVDFNGASLVFRN
jgi:ATP-dependent Clp protease ATP-binding subunit ClpB